MDARFWLHDLWHPLTGRGYQFWSGIGAGSPLFVIVGLWWQHHKCHVQGCLRLVWHAHPDHGHPVCRRHHPDDVCSGSTSQPTR